MKNPRIPMTSLNSKEQDLILVVGATGDLGGEITRNLLLQNRNVRILIRSHSNYQSLVEAGAQPILGDLKDLDSLKEACKDVKILITTATATQRKEPDNPVTVDLEGNRSLIDAAKSCGVRQFIFTSLSIADVNSPVLFVQAKAKTEDYLRESKLPFTIVASNAFMETWIALPIGIPAVMDKTVIVVGEGKRKHSFISLKDVAKFIISSIDNPKAINQRLVIGGPKPLSFLESIAIFEDALKRKIPTKTVAIGEPVPGLPQLMAEMLAGLNFFDSAIEMEELSKTFGIKLVSMAEFAQEYVRNFGDNSPKKF
jgi:uncharacterized protein YbjT (DUF2867 family)